jgi:hypothetical protein
VLSVPSTPELQTAGGVHRICRKGLDTSGEDQTWNFRVARIDTCSSSSPALHSLRSVLHDLDQRQSQFMTVILETKDATIRSLLKLAVLKEV